MSELYQIAESFRAALLRRDEAAQSRLLAEYGRVFSRILRQLARLNQKIEDARARGETVDFAWLLRQERYAELLNQVDAEFRKYADFTERVITAQQADAVQSAIKDSQRLMGAAASEAGISATFNRLPSSAVENLVGFLGDGSPLSTLLGRFGPVARQKAEGVLIEAVALGRNPRAIQTALAEALGVNRKRALTIARTETIRAYREATHRSFQEDSDVLEGWYWLAAKSKRTCAACLALDGTFHELNERMKSHVNCIPAGAMIHAPGVQASTARWYEGELVEFVTVGGYRLAVTPNHPILTAKGWIAAGLLKEGDNVISARFPERLLAAVNPDENNIPARIEQIVSAFAERVGVLSVSMPAAPEDFHGDGEGSQVHVVNVNGLLGDSFNASFFEPLSHQQFRSASVGLAGLASGGPLDFLFDGLDALARGGVRGLRVPQIFFRCARSHHQAISFSDGAALNSAFSQNAIDYVARNLQAVSDSFLGFASQVAGANIGFGQHDPALSSGIFYAANSQNFPAFSVSPEAAGLEFGAQGNSVGFESLRDVLAAFPGNVSQDRVLKITRRNFSGHVYNLQTNTGWYISNNIITHNCRCTAIPAVQGMPSPITQTGRDWFAQQDAKTQREILNSQVAADYYRAGRVRLEDFVGLDRDPRWGDSYHQIGLRRALAGEGAFPGDAARRRDIIPEIFQPAPNHLFSHQK